MGSVYGSGLGEANNTSTHTLSANSYAVFPRWWGEGVGRYPPCLSNHFPTFNNPLHSEKGVESSVDSQLTLLHLTKCHQS